MLRFECHCGHTATLSDTQAEALAGKRVRCAKCGSARKIPFRRFKPGTIPTRLLSKPSPTPSWLTSEAAVIGICVVGLIGLLLAGVIYVFWQLPQPGGEASVVSTFVVGCLFLSFYLYFIPTLISLVRGHHNRLAICVLNIFLGWTCLGWIASLVWAFTAVDDSP